MSGPIDLTYNYYANGNVYTIDDARTDKSATFHYDHLDRLASIEGFGAVTFDYDAQGNRTFKDYGTGAQITYTYDSATNRLTSATGSPGQP